MTGWWLGGWRDIDEVLISRARAALYSLVVRRVEKH